LILLDTTILVYAIGSEHPAREPSRRLVEAIANSSVAATTTVEVIQEFVHVSSRRRSRTTAIEHARKYVTGLAPLLAAGQRELEHGLRLYERHERLGAFDAVLAATALAHDVDALVSVDHSFAAVPRLRHIAPGTPEFERLLA
jgi:uncharacterized protein